MKELKEYDKRRIAEITGVESFILIGCDSALPCDDNEGGCNNEHRFEINIHRIDHLHTVDLLNQVRNIIMHEGIKK